MVRYVLQPEHSVVQVVARSTLRPFSGAAPIAGHFEAFLTAGRLDLSQPPAGVLHLRVDELRGDMPHLDREFRKRMNSDRYPTITAVLKEVTERPGGGYLMTGELTLHGRTQLVDGEATVDVAAEGPLTLRGALRLDIRDFGLVPPKLLMLKVHPQIEVRLAFTAAASE